MNEKKQEDEDDFISDQWTTEDLLCLASAVSRSGDKNWVSVARAVRSFGDPNRPAEWYTPKKCALQYSKLLKSVEDKKKSLPRTERETPEELVVKHLTELRMKELDKCIEECLFLGSKMQDAIMRIEKGELRGKLDELVSQLESDDRYIEDRYQKWISQKDASPVKRPSSFSSLVTKGKASASKADDQQTSHESIEHSSESQAAHSTSGKEVAALSSQANPRTVPSPQPFFNPSNLLANAGARMYPFTSTSMAHGNLLRLPDSSTVSTVTTGYVSSVTLSAPTLSKLLEMPPSVPGKLPPLPTIFSTSESVPVSSDAKLSFQSQLSKEPSQVAFKSKDGKEEHKQLIRLENPNAVKEKPKVAQSSTSSTSASAQSESKQMLEAKESKIVSSTNQKETSTVLTKESIKKGDSKITETKGTLIGESSMKSQPIPCEEISGSQLLAPQIVCPIEKPIQEHTTHVAFLFEEKSQAAEIKKDFSFDSSDVCRQTKAGTKRKEPPQCFDSYSISDIKASLKEGIITAPKKLRQNDDVVVHNEGIADKVAASTVVCDSVSKPNSRVDTSSAHSLQNMSNVKVSINCEKNDSALEQNDSSSVTNTFPWDNKSTTSANRDSALVHADNKNIDSAGKSESNETLPFNVKNIKKEPLSDEVSCDTQNVQTNAAITSQKSACSKNPLNVRSASSGMELSQSKLTPLPHSSYKPMKTEVKSEYEFHENESEVGSIMLRKNSVCDNKSVGSKLGGTQLPSLSSSQIKSEAKNVKEIKTLNSVLSTSKSDLSSTISTKPSVHSSSLCSPDIASTKTAVKVEEPRPEFWTDVKIADTSAVSNISKTPHTVSLERCGTEDKFDDCSSSSTSNENVDSNVNKTFHTETKSSEGGTHVEVKLSEGKQSKDDEKTSEKVASGISKHVVPRRARRGRGRVSRRGSTDRKESSSDQIQESCDMDDDVSNSGKFQGASDKDEQKEIGRDIAEDESVTSSQDSEKEFFCDSRNSSHKGTDDQDKSDMEDITEKKVSAFLGDSSDSFLKTLSTDTKHTDMNDSLSASPENTSVSENSYVKGKESKERWSPQSIDPASQSSAVTLSSSDSSDESDNSEESEDSTESGAKQLKRKDRDIQHQYKTWKKSISIVWREASYHKYANVFSQKVTDDVAPGYHSIVYRPMDLSLIKKNIDNGTIKTTQEFQRDMMLMFQNAIMYNSSDHDVYHMAVEMQRDVNKQIQDYLATQQIIQDKNKDSSVSSLRNARQSKTLAKPPQRSSSSKTNM